LAVGPALTAVNGFAALETEQAYTRARELGERLGDSPELFPALLGLWLTHLVRGELRTAYELAGRLMRGAQNTHAPSRLLWAHIALGTTSYYIGEFPSAREHLQMAGSLYDRERHRPLTFRYGGIDAGMICLSYMAWTLWQLGYPDQALKRGNEALALAQALSHPFSLAGAEIWVGVVHQLRREARAAQATAEDAIAFCAEHGFTDYLAWATSLHGWAMAEHVHKEEGIAQIQEGLAASRATGGIVAAILSLSAGRGVPGDGPPLRRAKCFDGSAGRRR